MNKKLSLIAVITLFFGALFFGIYSTTKSVAATATANLSPVYKILLSDVATCYANNIFKPTVSFSSLSRGATIDSVLQNNSSTKVLIPTGLIGTLDDKTKEITCKELLDGRNTFFHGDSSGIIKDASALPSRASSSAEIDSFLRKLGYQPPENNARKCFRYIYDYSMVASGGVFGWGLPDPVNETRYTDYICAEVDSNNKTTKVEIDKSSAGIDIVQFELKNGGTRIQLDCNTTWFGDGGCGAFNVADYDWEGLQNAILAELGGKNSTKYYSYNSCAGATDCYFPVIYDHTYKLSTAESVIDQNVNGDLYTLGIDADQSLLEALSGSKTVPIITEDDVASLYITYLLKYFDAQQVCGLTDQQKTVYQSSYGAVEYRANSEGKACYVYPNKHKTDTVNSMVKIGNAYYINSTGIDFKGIVEWLKKYNGSVDVDLDSATPLEPETSTMPGAGSSGSSNSGGGSDDDGVNPCLEAAESLGWVLCPVLDFLGRTINTIYESVEDSFLVVDAGMLGDDTHRAWETFRNFANVLFVIAFLIVILSQITGFGVSNYGVKKILPRLIAIAILVNISFILCQLAVDVSNIVGADIKELLGKLGGVHPDGEVSAGAIAAQILSVLGLGATVAAAPAILAALTESASFWLLPVLVSFLGFLVGIFFAGILLAARQAGVIILVVLSPAAIICYALPNTKSIFDKWRKAFVALLLVYPMCGAIVGGGQFATSLLINNNGGFFYTLVAMLLSIVPFFFIPSMVRSAMSSLGGIGAKISGAGQRFGRWAQGAVRGSNFYKDAQRDLDRFSAERTVNNLNNREARRGRLSDRQKRRRSRALSRGMALQEEDTRAAADTRAFPSTRTAEGRAALEAMRSKIFEDAMDDRTAEEEAAYRNSKTLDVNSISDLEAEHQRLINALDANPDDAKSLAQMRAIQNLLMTQGDPGQEAIFQNYMNRANSGGNSSGLRAAARHIASNGKYMQKIKAEDKGLFSAVNHFKTGDFSHAGIGASAYYGAQGAGGYTAQTLAAADLGAIDRLVEGVQAGTISGGDLSKLTSLANEALSNPNLQIKGDVRQRLENLVAAGYSAGGSVTGVSSAGSTALSGASLETLDSMVQRIRAINGGTAFTGTPTAGAALDQYNEVQAMARNAERALRNPNTPHDAATVERLQDILMAAQDMGVQDTSGADFNRVDPAAIRIRGVEKRTAPALPPGWTASGMWDVSAGLGATPTKQQEIAYQEWAKKKAEVDMWNKDHGF